MNPLIKTYRRETQLKEDVIKFIKERFGYDVWFYKSSDKFTKGIPDLILCFYGRFVAIELKRDAGSRIEPLQVFNIRRIQRADGFGFIAMSVDEVKVGLLRIKEIVGK